MDTNSKNGSRDNKQCSSALCIRLQNQTDHSGVMVQLLELDQFVITDSTGEFTFDRLPDGIYTLQAKYPYFRTDQITVQVENGNIQTPVGLELKQQLQFWIKPVETTISMSNRGNPDFFSLYGFRQYRVNITNIPVNVSNLFEPIDLQAFVPQGFDLPYVPNVDSIPDLCYLFYGWLGSTDLSLIIMLTFQPGDTSVAQVGASFASKTAFKPVHICSSHLFRILGIIPNTLILHM